MPPPRLHDMDAAAIYTAHKQRLSDLDKLVAPSLSAEPADGEHLFTADQGGAQAAGITVTTTAPEGDSRLLWGAATNHLLRLACTQADSNDAAGQVLDAWLEVLEDRAVAGDTEHCAGVRLAARDAAAVRALAWRGFAPLIGTAVRRRGAQGPRGGIMPAGVRLRPLSQVNRDSLLDMMVALHAEDCQWGSITPRENAREMCADALLGPALELDDDCAVAAVRDDEVVGFATWHPPTDDSWWAGGINASAAYLGSAYIRPDLRGSAMGSAMVGHLHGRADAKGGPEVTVLDHALPSASSTQFWYTHGYRPLWTTWYRRPAHR